MASILNRIVSPTDTVDQQFVHCFEGGAISYQASNSG